MTESVYDFAAIKAVLKVWKPEPRKEPEPQKSLPDGTEGDMRDPYTVSPESLAEDDAGYGLYGGPSALKQFQQQQQLEQYRRLLGNIGLQYGNANGVFNLPDLRGRVSVGLDNFGSAYAGRLTSKI